MTWLVFALLGVASSVSYNLLARVLAVKSENPRAFSVVFNTAAVLVSLFLFLVEPWHIGRLSRNILLLTFLSTIFMGLFERTQFYARKEINASTLAIFFRLIPLVSVITSVIIFQETLTPQKILAILLIIGGNLLIFKGNTKLLQGKGLLYATIAAVSLGLAWPIDKRASAGFSISTYALLIWTIPIFYNLFIPPLSWLSLKKEVKLASWKLFVLAFSNVLAYYFLLRAQALADTTKVVPIISSSTIFVVLLGMILLGEKENALQKMVAALIVVSGIVIMSLS